MNPEEKEEIKKLIVTSIEQTNVTVIKGVIEPYITSLSTQIGIFEEINKETHKRIIEKQDKTNGKIEKLENETRFIRWCTRNPKTAVTVIIISVVGLITVSIVFGLDKLAKLIQW
jgi:preprotein translocase subunit SecE